jgi:hypothetical protein
LQARIMGHRLISIPMYCDCLEYQRNDDDVFGRQPIGCGKARSRPLFNRLDPSTTPARQSTFLSHSVNAHLKQTKAVPAMSRSHIFSTLYRRSAPRSTPSHRPNPFIPNHPSQCYRRYQHQYRESYGARMRRAWNSTRVTWYSIPVAAGIGFLGARQLYKTTRERARMEEQEPGDEDDQRPKRRKRIRPSGPW